MMRIKLNQPTSIALAIVGAALLVASTTPKIITSLKVVQNFPATACPGNLSDGVATAALANSEVRVRGVSGASTNMVKSGVSNYLVKNPLLVAGQKLSAISVIRGSSPWLATAVCSISDGDAWFVGGSGALTSKASFDIVNSGLSSSVIDLYVFTKRGGAPLSSVTVPANSEKRIFLDALAPGEDSIVIHAITRSGLVSTFLFDERRKGLRSLGADFVSEGAEPETRVVIPAISNQLVNKGKQTQQRLRILAPGNIDATVKATVVSSDGSFAPIGLDNFVLAHGNVKEIDFLPVIASSTYSLVLNSDQPIVASVLSTETVSEMQDFAWSTSAKPLASVSLNFGGLTPTAQFFGSNIAVQVSWLAVNGASGSQQINGSDSATWTSKFPLRRASFAPVAEMAGNIYGAIIFQNSGGLSQLPLTPGAVLESARVPLADAGVIARR